LRAEHFVFVHWVAFFADSLSEEKNEELAGGELWRIITPSWF
jgi:hypothetical protein